MRDTLRFDPSDRFHLMLFLALILHALFLLPLGINALEQVHEHAHSRELEVIGAWHPAEHDPILANAEAPFAQHEVSKISPFAKGVDAQLQEDLKPAYASTRAAYLLAFKQQIETKGLLNYPRDLIGKNFYRLMVNIQLNALGEVMALKIIKSSGSPDLDAAALAIIRRAAPFSPVPPALQQPDGTLTLVRQLEFGKKN